MGLIHGEGLPAFQLGLGERSRGEYRFQIHEIDAWLEAHRVPVEPRPDVSQEPPTTQKRGRKKKHEPT
jgi:hypothetical protein